MRKIIVATFMSMDGVLQSPGGPEEDPTNGFEWGGWQFSYRDDVADKALGKLFEKPFELLLGRRTYEIFAAYWPYQDDEIGRLFNSINKYVVATTSIDTSWSGSHLINKDVVGELRRLKAQEGPDLLVHGSGKLVQTLFENKLVDLLHLFIYPLTLGKGKRLFEGGTPTQEWTMTESAIGKTGVICASYIPGGGVHPESYPVSEPSKAELERRDKWKKGG